MIQVNNILCLGKRNSCRGPMMEALFQKEIQERKLNISVTSAGIETKDLSHPDENAVAVIREEYGIDISNHFAKSVNDLDLSKFDAIYCVGQKEKDAAIEMGADSEKVFILNEENGGIINPHGRDIGAYKLCATVIETSIKKIIEKLQ